MSVAPAADAAPKTPASQLVAFQSVTDQEQLLKITAELVASCAKGAFDFLSLARCHMPSFYIRLTLCLPLSLSAHARNLCRCLRSLSARCRLPAGDRVARTLCGDARPPRRAAAQARLLQYADTVCSQQTRWRHRSQSHRGFILIEYQRFDDHVCKNIAGIPSHFELYFVCLLYDAHPTRWLMTQRAAAAAAVEAAGRARRRRARSARDRFRIRVCAAAQCRGQAARVDGNVSGAARHPPIVDTVCVSRSHWFIADMNIYHSRNITRNSSLKLPRVISSRSASHTSIRRSARFCRTWRAPPPSP
jgi:hypothetical protein